MTKRLLLLLAVATAGAGCAPSVAVPEAARPVAKAPPVEYRSALEGYEAFADDQLLPWRDANEAVKKSGEHGGHR